jgi:predicted amidohydrolase YtcJ
MSGDLLIHDATVGGRRCDVRVEAGRIVEMGEGLRAKGASLDARGGELLPGLADHHLHLLATAAQARSLALDPESDFAAAVRARDRALPAGAELRVTGYHESFAGDLDAARLDALAPGRPVRVQHRTGGLWVLNTRALEIALADGDPPQGLERDSTSRPTGRVWRNDDWIRRRFPAPAPDLSELGRGLARQGVTHLADASATNDETSAALFAEAMQRKHLPQRLMLMSAGPLRRSCEAPWTLGPIKILLDDRDLPPPEAMGEIVDAARTQRRAVAVHCVTAAELAVTLAAFDSARAEPGDRVEHGGVITPEAAAEIRRLGLAVVTQPGFIAERGESYRRDVDRCDQPHLYRCASLIAAGVPTAGGTDAPYTRPDLWAAIDAAIRRTTAAGVILSPGERLPPRRALALFLGTLEDPAGPPRRVAPCADADLMLLRDRFESVAADGFADPVAATIVGGDVVWSEGLP